MKYLILISAVFSAAAFAADECASVWVYQPFKTCTHPANGLDTSQPGTVQTDINLWSAWLSGGRNQVEICRDVAQTFTSANANLGLQAEVKHPNPFAEETVDRLVQQQYRYACEIEVKKFPFRAAGSKACGTEDKFSYQVGGSSKSLAGENLTCLSCENLADQKPEAMVACLKQNLETIVKPKAIELRDSDLIAVSRQASRLLKLSRQINIENLQTVDQLSYFSDFVSNHPVPENQNGPRGGGNLPTLQ